MRGYEMKQGGPNERVEKLRRNVFCLSLNCTFRTCSLQFHSTNVRERRRKIKGNVFVFNYLLHLEVSYFFEIFIITCKTFVFILLFFPSFSECICLGRGM